METIDLVLTASGVFIVVGVVSGILLRTSQKVRMPGWIPFTTIAIGLVLLVVVAPYMSGPVAAP